MSSIGKVAPIALALAACTPPADELYQGFDWEVSRTGMRDALYGSCAGDGTIYAAGGQSDSGTLLRWAGGRWIAEPAFPPGALRSCSAGQKRMLVAVGQMGSLLRRTGEGWRDDSKMPAIDLHAAKIFNDGTAIVVGRGESDVAIALHFDPESQEWSEKLLPFGAPAVLEGLWAPSSTRAWAVGPGGTILAFDGEEWTLEDSGTSEDLHAIYGTSVDELFVAGDGGILRRDGTSWARFADADQPLRGLWTQANRPLYVAGDHSYVARFERRRGELRADLLTTDQPDETLCATSVSGSGHAVFVSAVDCDSGLGAMLSHGVSFAGPIFTGE
jgi:hypothetical protein